MRDPKKLIEFYIECIEKEEINQLTLEKKDLGKKFLIDVLNKEQFFHNNIEQVSIPLINKIHKDFCNKLTPNNHLFYVYPLFFTNENRISPIFFTELIFESKNDIFTIIKMSITPEFNHYILKNRGLTDEEINLNREKIDQMENFQNKLDFISRLIGTNCVLSQELSNEKLLVPMGSEFVIHNKSVIYFGERTGFTWSLLKELDNLKKKQTNRLMSTPLNYLFNPKELNNQRNNGEIKPILNIFALNPSQFEAVHDAFLKKITVVTGPPGTGKSQVVLNILANAVWNNNIVLFASRNNQAVNVVWEKMNKIIPKELIMRMGNGENRKQTKTSLIEILKNRNTICENIHDVEKLQKELDIKNSSIEEIKNKINDLSKINKSIEQALINIEIFSKTIPSELLEKCDKIPINLDIFELKNDIRNISFEPSFFNKLLKLIYPGYFRKKEYKIFRKYYDGLNLEYKKFFDKNLQLSDFEILKSLNWLLAISQISSWNEEINTSKSKLKCYSSLFNYLNQIKTTENEKVPISGEILKNYWLKKISKIEPSNQNDILKYFDTTEKLEKYNPPEIYFNTLAEQIKSFRETTQFLPVWIVTNLSAKNSFPLQENIFDLLVIDEASQCDIASALPLIFRAKNIVIIGDPEQLKFITTLKTNTEQKIANTKGIFEFYSDAFSYCKNSIFDLSERTINTVNDPVIFLNEHYRCHKDIITYSNKYFYGEKLNILTDESALFSDPDLAHGMAWINVKGKTQYGKSILNFEEANEVIKILKNYCEIKKEVTIGVVTFFKAQMDLIESMIKNEPIFENTDITVGTAHKFQGDEKDIIIFSPAISEGVQQKTLNWINDTKQLLNVAITRARSSLIIVGDLEKCENEKGFMRSLAEYWKSIKNIKEPSFDSGIEKILFDELSKNKIKVIPQYNVMIQNKKKYRLDFAIFVNQKKFDIEIDGAKAHSGKSDFDDLRDTHLRSDGWNIRRFPASMVENNLDGVIDEISKLC